MTTHPLTGRSPHSLSRRALLLVLAAALVAGGSYLIRSHPSRTSTPAGAPDIAAPTAPPLDGLARNGSPGGLLPPAARVAFWEGRVASSTTPSYLDLIYLSDAYLDRSRATGDIDDLKRAEAALQRASAVTADPKAVVVRQALVAFSLHEWQRALDLADGLLADDSQNLAALGVSGDARLETGDIAGATARYHALEALVQSPAVWSRLGRLAFLTGDADAAIALVQRAVSGAVEEGYPDAIAFYRFQLGELYRQRGDADRAAASYEAALVALPDYVPATVGLGRAREAQGRRADAIALLERAVARLPQPETVATLGDLYALDGEAPRAAQEYALVDRIAQVAAATGSVYDRQLTLFAADHDRDIGAAVKRARQELTIRGDVYGYDALAWALFKDGQLADAAEAAEKALALGTPDPRIAYHAGMIAAAQGHSDDARRLLAFAVAGSSMLPPLQVPIARAALVQLDVEAAR